MIRHALALVAGSVLCIATCGAIAQDVLMLEGKCQELVVADLVMTRGCENTIAVSTAPKNAKIVQIMKRGGAHNFYFTGTPSGKVALIAVEVSLYPMEERWEVMEVKGSCTFENLIKLPAKISCKAKDANGFDYKLRFRAVSSRPLELPGQ